MKAHHVIMFNGKLIKSYASAAVAKADATGPCFVASKPADLAKLSKVSLAVLLCSLDKSVEVKTLEKTDKNFARVFDALGKVEVSGSPTDKPEKPTKAKKSEAAEKPAKANKPAKSDGEASAPSCDGPRPSSKLGKMVALLREGPASLTELAEASGYDEPNTRTAIAVLRSGRTKGGIQFDVQLDRASGKYSLAA